MSTKYDSFIYNSAIEKLEKALRFELDNLILFEDFQERFPSSKHWEMQIKEAQERINLLQNELNFLYQDEERKI